MFPHCSLWFNFADFAVLFSLFAFHIISSQLLSVYWYSTSLIKFWPSLCNNAIHSLLENTLAVSLSSSSRVFLGAICYSPHSPVIYDLNQDHICTYNMHAMPCHQDFDKLSIFQLFWWQPETSKLRAVKRLEAQTDLTRTVQSSELNVAELVFSKKRWEELNQINRVHISMQIAARELERHAKWFLAKNWITYQSVLFYCIVFYLKQVVVMLCHLEDVVFLICLLHNLGWWLLFYGLHI